MLLIILWMVGFSLLHSLMADRRFKRSLDSVFSERFRLGWYRLFYNAISVITLAPIFIYSALNAEAIYSISGIGAFVMMSIQLVGLIGATLSIIQIDWLRFAGFRQAWAYLKDQPLPLNSEPLTTTGLYAYMRHPLYFFSLLLLWFTPTMTTTGLAFNIGATAYFVLGSIVEERRMVQAFGKDYVAYQKQVSWMIPFLPRFTSS
ncbi:MAG: DUF1295 domain-containing protein [Chloroflexota bacterium]